jgi:hypothetical protein
MPRASIRSRYLVAWLALAGAAANPGLEYRFKALDGMDFKWRDGKVEKLLLTEHVEWCIRKRAFYGEQLA